jgi:hypothetical protein
MIISGASQGHDLFLTRQDRYWVIRDCKELCDYAMDNLRVFYNNSYHINGDGEVFRPDHVPCPQNNTKIFKNNFRLEF